LVPIDRATFLETEFGRLRSQGSLVHKFRLWVAEAGLGGSDRNGRNLTLHGLRKAVGRRLAEAGAATHVIMSWLGHESIASAQVYTKAYDRARAADLGAELLSGTEADRKANSNVRTFAVAAKRKSDDKPLK
jgi:integrase